MKASEAAKHIGIAPSTLRAWAREEWNQYMTEATITGRSRRYGWRDVQVMTYVKDQKEAGTSTDEIHAALKQRQSDGWNGLPQVEGQPDEPEPVAMVTEDFAREHDRRLRDEIERLEDRVDELLEEAQNERAMRRDVEKELADTQAALAAAKARLEMIERERRPFSYWLSVIAVVVAVIVVLAAVVVWVILATGGLN